MANADNAIVGSDESNNSAELNINVNKALIDLVIDSVKTCQCSNWFY